jgi:hypothetical protein
MAKEIINVGTSANDHTGDALRNAFIKTVNNDNEQYAKNDAQDVTIAAHAGAIAALQVGQTSQGATVSVLQANGISDASAIAVLQATMVSEQTNIDNLQSQGAIDAAAISTLRISDLTLQQQLTELYVLVADLQLQLSAIGATPITTYYVADYGNDSTGTGRIDAPLATRAKAYSVAVAGDEVRSRLLTTWNTAEVVPAGTVIFVSTTGNDAADGSFATPFLTIAHAVSVAVSTDLIFIMSGNYTQASILGVSPGISFTGEGKASSVIHCTYATDMAFNFSSATLENGGHNISYLGFDGDTRTGYRAISISKRNNCKIHECDFKDFSFSAVKIANGAGFANTRPAVYATGNEFYNNTMTDAGATWATSGSFLFLTGQEGFKCYGNVATSNSVGGNPPGIIVKASELKALDMYNNTFTIVGNDDEPNWAFAFEVWDIADGSKIRDNVIQGVLDIVNIFKGNATFGVSIYGNTLGFSSMQTVAKHGIYLEGNIMDVEIKSNTFNHLSTPVILYTLAAHNYSNIRIHHNVFDGIGFVGSTYNSCVTVAGAGGFTLTGYYIENNTFVSGTTGANTFVAITIPAKGTTSNVYIRNNIIKDFDRVIVSQYAPTGGMTIDNVFIQNNDFFSNGYSDAPAWMQVVPTNITLTGNITTDPLFVSESTGNFTLQSASPAIATGTDGLNMGAY